MKISEEDLEGMIIEERNMERRKNIVMFYNLLTSNLKLNEWERLKKTIDKAFLLERETRDKELSIKNENLLNLKEYDDFFINLW
jgi:hypothetical protein|nr:MAG TPA: hypothetical protein [Caudoviricetes sp.]